MFVEGAQRYAVSCGIVPRSLARLLIPPLGLHEFGRLLGDGERNQPRRPGLAGVGRGRRAREQVLRHRKNAAARICPLLSLLPLLALYLLLALSLLLTLLALYLLLALSLLPPLFLTPRC